MPMPSARPKFFWPAKIKFWLAKLFLASQNLILAGQKNFGRADGIGIKHIFQKVSYSDPQ